MTPVAQFSDQWQVLSALLDKALNLAPADPAAGSFLRPAQRRLLVAQGHGQQALREYQRARAVKKLPKDPASSQTVGALTESAWLQALAQAGCIRATHGQPVDTSTNGRQ